MDLRQNILRGDISSPSVKSLHTIILKPKMAYAIKHDICPIIDCLFIVSDKYCIRVQKNLTTLFDDASRGETFFFFLF